MPNPDHRSPNWKDQFRTSNSPKSPPTKPAPDLRARYQLPAQPAGVQQIVNLVKGKDNSCMEEIVEIIDKDFAVTGRLISLAYPKPAARLGATVQMATSRLGVNRVIVVVIGDLLTKAVIDTFETMVGLTLKIDETSDMANSDQMYLTGTVKFAGRTKGQVTLAFPPSLRMMAVARLLGGTMDDRHPPEVINDIIGELVNIVTGNLQSLLCDAGFQSEVEVPEVKFQSSLPKDTVPGGSSDQFFFRSGMYTLAVNLSVAPQAPPLAPSR